MSLFETYGKEIVALLVPLITWALNTFFKATARLYLATPHTFTFIVQHPLLDPEGNQIAPNQTVHTRSILVWNAGKDTARGVECVFNWKPPCMNVWPPRHFEEHTEPDNRYVIVFDTLAPDEYFDCELLSVNAELPNLLTVRSDQCLAQTRNMYPQPVVPAWKRRAAVVLIFAGLALVTYLIIVLIQFLVLRTPLGH